MCAGQRGEKFRHRKPCSGGTVDESIRVIFDRAIREESSLQSLKSVLAPWDLNTSVKATRTTVVEARRRSRKPTFGGRKRWWFTGRRAIPADKAGASNSALDQRVRLRDKCHDGIVGGISLILVIRLIGGIYAENESIVRLSYCKDLEYAAQEIVCQMQASSIDPPSRQTPSSVSNDYHKRSACSTELKFRFLNYKDLTRLTRSLLSSAPSLGQFVLSLFPHVRLTLDELTRTTIEATPIVTILLNRVR
ncbi:hypothetical protein CPB85DRAFT_1258283 [Mucidula mucida]|nr:hypothetical protein CPB85DRAFT_1258283 [Mucidula mucida]